MTDVATEVAEFETLLEKKAELEQKIKDEAKDVFANSSKAIFEKYGDKVGVFGWQQYTPYFNDGDPCTFSTGEIFIYTPEEHAKGKDGEQEDFEYSYWESGGLFGGYSNEQYHWKKDGEVCKWEPYKAEEYGWTKFENPDWDPTLDISEAKQAVLDLCRLIDNDTALALFGDHTTVIVTPEGVETEECEHE